MIQLDGIYYDGQSSVAHQAVLTSAEGEVSLCIDGAKPIQLTLSELEFSDPVGKITRNINWLVDGDMVSFQTNEVEVFDQWLKDHDIKKTVFIIDFFEKHLAAVIAALVMSVVLIYSFVTYGVPAASRVIAYQIPPYIYSFTTEQTLALLDKTLFEPSKIDDDEQARIELAFLNMTRDADWPNGFDLQFRAMGYNGNAPNAMALPSGVVIVTDGLIKLAENDEEIMAVLAHEAGHVINRHGITAVVQASILTASVTFLTGELSGLSEMLISNSVILTQMSYSRALEKEADLFSKQLLIETGTGDAILLVDMLKKMEEYYGGDVDGDADENVSDYFSSHPMTHERVKYLLE